MRILIVLITILLLPACSTLGVATDAGASLGVASQSEGGIGAAARDLEIKAHLSDLWFRYNVETYAKLTATVRLGRVMITGVVQNPDQRVQAVRLAWQVDGVRQVINEIRVAKGDGFPGYVSDQWITARLRTELTFERDVYSINYSIDTVQGTVYLMGVARSETELDSVTEIARTIPGVQKVVSYIVLQEAPKTLPEARAASPVTVDRAPVPLMPASRPGAVEATPLP